GGLPGVLVLTGAAADALAIDIHVGGEAHDTHIGTGNCLPIALVIVPRLHHIGDHESLAASLQAVARHVREVAKPETGVEAIIRRPRPAIPQPVHVDHRVRYLAGSQQIPEMLGHRRLAHADRSGDDDHRHRYLLRHASTPSTPGFRPPPTPAGSAPSSAATVPGSAPSIVPTTSSVSSTARRALVLLGRAEGISPARTRGCRL